MELLVGVFLSILKSSLTASVIILILILFLKVFNKKISVHVKNVIWVLVLVKILIPVNDNMNANISHIFYEIYETVVQPQSEEIHKKSLASGDHYNGSIEVIKNKNFIFNVFKFASFLWFIGVFLFSSLLFVSQLNLKRKTKNFKSDIDLDTLIKKCNIKTKIPVYLYDKINSPCIFGIMKPKIYIPTYVLNISDKNQLSYIFLHELVHYKRKDLIYNFFSILALIIHWFNPFVWLAVKKMNLYRECACDACVLELLKEEENIDYGMTLLNLSKSNIQTGAYSYLPVFFNTNNQMNDRIRLIKSFKKDSYKIKTKAILGCTVAAIVILTNNLTVDALNKENIIFDNHTTGWVSSNQKWFYYDNGVMLKNTSVAGYYLGADGAMIVSENDNTSETTGPTSIESFGGEWYYTNYKWYFINKANNSYVKGWLHFEDHWYYFDKQGAMVTDRTLKIDGKDYIFTSDSFCTNKE